MQLLSTALHLPVVESQWTLLWWSHLVMPPPHQSIPLPLLHLRLQLRGVQQGRVLLLLLPLLLHHHKYHNHSRQEDAGRRPSVAVASGAVQQGHPLQYNNRAPPVLHKQVLAVQSQ